MSFIREQTRGLAVNRRERVTTAVSIGLTLIAACGAIAALGYVLYSACCAFTWKNFLMSDYGVYTNTIWNLSRGNGFAFLVDHDYLKTHLSFSLWFLCPLFYVWNHPMLLIVVQWLFLVGGVLILLALARRSIVPPVLIAAILFFFCAYPWTQSVMLSEFHGVSAYFLLIPWLVYCISFHKTLVILPLTIILGLREDAGLLLPLVFIYFAVRDRWKVGYVYAALSAVYSVVAITCLYPLINGRHLFDVRISEGQAFDLMDTLNFDHLRARLVASFWTMLPLTPFLIFIRRGWRPLAILPAAAWLIAMASGIPRQHMLLFHYPAALSVLVAAAMIIACGNRSDLTNRSVRSIITAALLCAITTVGHKFSGYLPGGRNTHHDYHSLQPDGVMTLNLAREIPREGTLVCNQHLAVFAANRKDIVTWRYWKRDEHPADLFFCDLLEFGRPDKAELADGLRRGSFGVRSMAFPFFVLERGARGELTPQVIEMIDSHTLMVAMMTMGGGANRIVPGVGVARYWEGDGGKASFPLAHGTFLALEAGPYSVTFRYRASPPGRDVLDSWGWFSVWEQGGSEPIMRVKIDERATDSFTQQVFRLELPAAARVEPRVEAGDAELWVVSVSFKKIENARAASADSQTDKAAGLIDNKGDQVGQ